MNILTVWRAYRTARERAAANGHAGYTEERRRLDAIATHCELRIDLTLRGYSEEEQIRLCRLLTEYGRLQVASHEAAKVMHNATLYSRSERFQEETVRDWEATERAVADFEAAHPEIPRLVS